MKLISNKLHSCLCALLLFVLLSNVLAICPQGYVDVSGVCVQQSSTCPSNYYLVNGMCFPNYQGNCQQAEVFINGKCCTSQCLKSCAGQSNCLCCTVSLMVSPHDLATPVPPLVPYPTQPPPAQPCPNAQRCPAQPVAPCPPTQPSAPCTTQPPSAPHVAPCAQPCPYPAQPQPCPSIQPCPTPPCSTIQPITPCFTPQVPCPIYPIYPPCVNTPTQTPAPPSPQTTTAIPTLPPTISTPRPTRPPTTITTTPGPLVKCPAGTIPVGNSCRLIYCGKGYYENNHCIQTVCPPGTIWTGIKCAPPEPTIQNIVFNNTVVTHFQRNESDIIVNNVNNFTFNNTIEVPGNESLPPPPSCEEETCDETTAPPAPTTPPPPPPSTPRKCCNVLTPRICKPNPSNSQWNCYTRRYRRCGDFCVAPTIYLKAPRTRNVDPYLVMPPDNQISSCRQFNLCAESNDYYDCSGCMAGIPESCSHYCYRSSCMTRSCAFYDQHNYCQDSPGEYGCQQQDGCFDSWCDGGSSY